MGDKTPWDILRSPRDKGQTGLKRSHVLQVVVGGGTPWDILGGTRNKGQTGLKSSHVGQGVDKIQMRLKIAMGILGIFLRVPRTRDRQDCPLGKGNGVGKSGHECQTGSRKRDD